MELEELVVPDAAGWRAWLEEHHTTSPGVWLALTRKGGTVTALTWDDAVLGALCFGWIDSQRRRRDAESSAQRMTPRGPRSRWSQINVEHVGRLTAAGLMAPAGLAVVEAARADGRWAAAYAPPSRVEVPDDLALALAANPGAQAMWDVLTSTNRFAILHRIGAVKRAETRVRNIERFVEQLARQETPYPQKARPE